MMNRVNIISAYLCNTYLNIVSSDFKALKLGAAAVSAPLFRKLKVLFIAHITETCVPVICATYYLRQDYYPTAR